MKHGKLIGLAVVAALALMAMVGASTASAKVCSASGTGEACAGAHGKVYNGTLAASLESGQHATLTSGFVNVTCKKSTLAGSVTNGGATPATGSITSLTFSECTDNLGRACTAGTTASAGNPWAATAKTGTAPNGFLEVSTVTGEFKCGETVCKYESAKVGTKSEITVTGGAPATVKATSVPLSGEATNPGLCSATAVWHGAYNVTTPSSLYLT